MVDEEPATEAQKRLAEYTELVNRLGPDHEDTKAFHDSCAAIDPEFEGLAAVVRKLKRALNG